MKKPLASVVAADYQPSHDSYLVVVEVLNFVFGNEELFKAAVRDAVTAVARDFAFKLVREHRPLLDATFDEAAVVAIVDDVVRRKLDAIAQEAIERSVRMATAAVTPK